MRRRFTAIFEGMLVGFILGFVFGAAIGSSDGAIEISHTTQSASVGETLTVLDVSETSSTWAARGVATWYDYEPGHAAAGPKLRRLIGPDWRGTLVRVSTGAGKPTVVVSLTDFCLCGDRQGQPTLIDLDVRDFEKIAPRSVGVVEIIVQPIPAPPDTSTSDATP